MCLCTKDPNLEEPTEKGCATQPVSTILHHRVISTTSLLSRCLDFQGSFQINQMLLKLVATSRWIKVPKPSGKQMLPYLLTPSHSTLNLGSMVKSKFKVTNLRVLSSLMSKWTTLSTAILHNSQIRSKIIPLKLLLMKFKSSCHRTSKAVQTSNPPLRML